MDHKTIIPAGESPIIHIKSVGEDIRIRGHKQHEVIIRTDDEPASYTIQDPNQPQSNTSEATNIEVDVNIDADAFPNIDAEGAANTTNSEQNTHAADVIIQINSLIGDTVLDIPMNAIVNIGQIGGDAQIRSVRGDIKIEAVGEDLSANQIGTIDIGSVGGELAIKQASGNVTIEAVGEDATCLKIAGNIMLNAGEDIAINDVQGNITAKAGEDAKLSLSLGDGQQVNVMAGSDISCTLSDEASAEVMLRSGNRTLRVRGWEVPPPPDDELYTFTLGKGAAALNLNAGEDIILASQSADGRRDSWFDYDIDLDFGPGFKFRFDSENGFPTEQFSNLFSEKIQAKVQNAMRHAEEQIANAISHAESRISKAEERAADFESKWPSSDHRRRGRHGRRHEDHPEGHPARDRRRRGPRRPKSPPPPHTPEHHAASGSPSSQQSNPGKAPVTEAERLMVLRMVEEGKINVEQAEKLLSAMGS